MAHPYKQKYNNFNGPGHQSPAHSLKGLWELGKLGVKWGKNLFKRSPKSPKFVPVDSPKGWKKIQETIGKRYVDDSGKIKKWNAAKDTGFTMYGYQVTAGEDERKEKDLYETKKDNIIFNPSTTNPYNTTEYLKRGN
tara:strand:- start:8 stop:418 length:411 start_codon:yes stop_codon:yes gene_type:complete